MSRVVPGTDFNPILDTDMDMIAVDGTCVSAIGVDLLKTRHGDRVHVIYSREEARRLVTQVNEEK